VEEVSAQIHNKYVHIYYGSVRPNTYVLGRTHTEDTSSTAFCAYIYTSSICASQHVCVGTHGFCVKKELCWKLYLYVNRVWAVEGGMSSALGLSRLECDFHFSTHNPFPQLCVRLERSTYLLSSAPIPYFSICRAV